MEMFASDLLSSVIFYFVVVAGVRVLGKRLVGQIASFDLVVLITLSVTLQYMLVRDDRNAKLIFIIAVAALHWLNTFLCFRFPKFRLLVRGKPTVLVEEGEVLNSNLRKELVTHAELQAGLRKSGLEKTEDVKKATLEETGQIAVVPK